MKTTNTRHGVIVNCVTAPVHSKSNNQSPVVCHLNALTDVEIVKDRSIDVFYYIRTLSGYEGYCLKEYIALRK